MINGPLRVCPSPTTSSRSRAAVIQTDIKGQYGVGRSVLSSFPKDLSETFKMSDIDATRLPYVIHWYPPCVGDDFNHTLTRGER